MLLHTLHFLSLSFGFSKPQSPLFNILKQISKFNLSNFISSFSSIPPWIPILTFAAPTSILYVKSFPELHSCFFFANELHSCFASSFVASPFTSSIVAWPRFCVLPNSTLWKLLWYFQLLLKGLQFVTSKSDRLPGNCGKVREKPRKICISFALTSLP